MRRAWSSFPEPVAPPTGSVGPAQFSSVFRRHPAAVTVVALRSAGRPYGFTASSIISVSREPPLLAFSVATRSAAWAAIARAPSLVINFLGADQAAVAERFASGGDRFRALDWSPLPTGEPVLAGVSSWIRGEVQQRVPAGSSHLVVVRATQARADPDRVALLYVGRQYHPGPEAPV